VYHNYIIFQPNGNILKKRYASKEDAKKDNLIARSIFKVRQS
jgi:hypothetical protein